jgi:thiol-disulfide isomerase/thioredoxin
LGDRTPSTREWLRRGAGWEAIRSHLGSYERALGMTGGAVSLSLHSTSDGAQLFFKENFVRLIIHPGCHLCDRAEPVVRRVARRLRVGLEVVDMDSDDELVRLYAWRIPVVLGPDGEVLEEGMIDERKLRAAVKGIRRRG